MEMMNDWRCGLTLGMKKANEWVRWRRQSKRDGDFEKLYDEITDVLCP